MKNSKRYFDNEYDDQHIPDLVRTNDLLSLYDAMDAYGEYEARSFAHWLSNQVYGGRTMDKLWRDYQEQINQPIES